MTEETIENTFTFRDWNESACDHCADYTSVVLLGSERVCRHCLEASFDESGDKIDRCKAFAEIAEDQARRIAAQNLAVNIAMMALGFLLCYAVIIGGAVR